MPTSARLALFLAGLALACAVTPQGPVAAREPNSWAAPPGTALVPASLVRLGTPREQLVALATAHPELGQAIAAELNEEPAVEVEALHVQVTEVTNEQYAEFVEATGHRPPIHWAGAALADAALAFNKEQARWRQAQRELGNRNPEREAFDEYRWWRDNWRDCGWSVPREQAAHPVVMVSLGDAEAYAGWAGMRLPTEAEWMAAGGRGEDFLQFPWGSDWDAAKAVAAIEGLPSGPLPVGSAPWGAVRHGSTEVFDLCGSVWEWTSSPLEALRGDRPRELLVTTGRGANASTRTLEARFDPDENIVKGGSYANGPVAARLSTRQGQQREQELELLGFRCVADPAPGLTLARNLEQHLPHALRPGPLAPERVLARDRYLARPGTAGVEGYAVPASYDHVAFVPVESLDERSGSKLARRTVKEGPAGLGVLSTTVELRSPALPPGRYRVAYLGRAVAGPADLDAGRDAPPGHTIVFTDERGELAATLPVERPEAGSLPRGHDPRGTLTFRPANLSTRNDTLTFETRIPTPSTKRAFVIELELELPRGAVDSTWR